jgi:hypothetical protein
MSWFDQIKLALPEYYRSDRPDDIVGYLRGSPDPSVWLGMEGSGRNQMLLLGNVEPDRQDWEAAGVAQRKDQTHAITFKMLTGFVVLYAGFIRRPWGRIHVTSSEALKNYQTQIGSWKRNKPRSP